jgi:SAM-dependent methyltransferase
MNTARKQGKQDIPGGTIKLSTEQHWSERWGKTEFQTLAFNPKSLHFRDLHALFQRYLPKSSNMSLLEIGCYPGGYMWYFNRFFDYQVSGIEYVEEFCKPMHEQLRRCGVAAEVFHGDILSSVLPETKQWDVVASLGLIEHFSDSQEVIRRHLALLKPGGYLILVIPNHAGINGKILKRIDPEKYEIHNCMTYEEMQDAVEGAGSVEILDGGYYGHMGFWNTGLHATLASKNRLLSKMIRSLLWAVACLGRLLPDSKRLSPYAALVARKMQQER